MGRIEKALEKANRQREEGVESKTPSEKQNQTDAAPGRFAVFESVPEPDIKNPCLVTVNDPDSPVAEQYRKLKSFVVKLTQRGKTHNSLMVTSTVGGEGKTVTALNLAITLAQEYDHTVLLVEADLRRPSILKYLGLEADVGLTDCIQEGLDVGKALVKTGIGKLSVLPGGKMVRDPVELLSSRRMKELLEEIKMRYSDRYVIVDTTPLLPFAEAHYIANIVDSVIFVVRQGHATLEKIKEAHNALKNTNLLGVVYNDVDGVFSGNGYYGYYGYYGYKKNQG